MTTVFVVDDHTLLRQSVVATIAAADGFEVVGDVGSVEDARPRVLAGDPPDVLVLDVNLPGMDGIEFAQEVRTAAPGVRILLLTMHEDARSVRRATTAGVAGYLTKVATQDELLSALRSLAVGGSYLSPVIATAMMDAARHQDDPDQLTEREAQILERLARGERVVDIALSLCLTTKTVQNHLSKVYAKLGVESGAQAVVAAYRRGLVAV